MPLGKREDRILTATVRVLLLLFRRLEDLKRAEERLIDAHHRSGVVELSAAEGRMS